jgi:hypothetical protein
MANGIIISEVAVERLRENMENNKPRYEDAASWVAHYFRDENWALQATVDMLEIDLQIPPAGTSQFDLENVKILYTALKHLTPVQASDERLWAYLTHVTFWKYMRNRWPSEQYAKSSRYRQIMQERYLFMGDRSRALIRNGIARLWWYGHASYDEARTDPFELTEALLKNLDVTQSILERAFSKNLTVTHAILTALVEQEQAGRPFYVRDKVRELAKYPVQIGGVTIIDALDFGDIRRIVGISRT